MEGQRLKAGDVVVVKTPNSSGSLKQQEVLIVHSIRESDVYPFVYFNHLPNEGFFQYRFIKVEIKEELM